ncbi:hypothetical protein BLOT_015710 [Blomia tropicalis]|nr:hypothetical protein BLOT_015710 [Blomia tropicalis]
MENHKRQGGPEKRDPKLLFTQPTNQPTNHKNNEFLNIKKNVKFWTSKYKEKNDFIIWKTIATKDGMEWNASGIIERFDRVKWLNMTQQQMEERETHVFI